MTSTNGPGAGASKLGTPSLTGGEAENAELTFDVAFTVQEIVTASPTYACARTSSAGTTRHASAGRMTAEANQEPFIFRKDVGEPWRIARYSFSPTKPPGEG